MHMTKKEHVPETTEATPNRAMRRHPEKVDEKEAAQVREEQETILKRGTDDDISVRAKSSGHGKKTADKWNQ
jgi:hypothetical protein